MGKKKIFLFIGILILLISVPATILILKQQTVFKLGAQSSDEPTNIQITNLTERTATVVWTTQRATQGMISYGLSPNNLTLVQIENAPAVNHHIILSNLLPENTYFFVIKTADKTFDNNGQPFTFTTKPQETTSPTTAPAPPISEEKLQSAMGTNDPNYDLNKDNIVNTLDLLLLREQKNK